MPSGLRQTPLGARKPVARISVRRAVLAHAEQRPVLRHERRLAVPCGLGVVEVPLGVGLQVHRELVEVLGHLVVAVEVLIEVGLAVAVRGRGGCTIWSRQPTWIVPSTIFSPSGWNRPEAIRRQVRPRPRVVDPADPPDVAVPGADGQLAGRRGRNRSR